ncbi:hypothetical protein ACHAWF_011536 [Thalassiosira exigua]
MDDTIDFLSDCGVDALPGPGSSNQIVSEDMDQCLNPISDDAPAPKESPTSVSPISAQTNPDPTIFQMNFDVEHLGKNKPQSKRMAVWKYGVLQESANGSSVAGHEAKLVWSTHSGKYTISVDGEEIFNSVAKGSVLEHKWKWSHRRGCIVESEVVDGECVTMRIIACRKPPVRASKDFRCYEFIIGGQLFRDLPINSNDGTSFGGDFQNEEAVYGYADGKLMSILDIIEPGWRAAGFA